MIRNLMFGMSLIALTSASAMAAPAAAHKTRGKIVAQAPAADAPAPATDKPAKKTPKHTKKVKGDAKADAKTPAPEAPKAN